MEPQQVVHSTPSQVRPHEILVNLAGRIHRAQNRLFRNLRERNPPHIPRNDTPLFQ